MGGAGGGGGLAFSAQFELMGLCLAVLLELQFLIFHYVCPLLQFIIF